MVYIGPENLKPAHQVIDIVRVQPEGTDFRIDYRVLLPFTNEERKFSITVPRDVQVRDPLWMEVTSEFAQLFPRREHMLVYRDALRTRIIEEVFKRTKKAKPKADKEAIRARAAAAKAKAAAASGKPDTAPAEQPAAAPAETAADQVKSLLAQAKEFERQAGDAILDGAQRKKAEMRARAFRAKAEKAAKDAGIDLSSLS